jgi:hypothetical protein
MPPFAGLARWWFARSSGGIEFETAEVGRSKWWAPIAMD